MIWEWQMTARCHCSAWLSAACLCVADGSCALLRLPGAANCPAPPHSTQPCAQVHHICLLLGYGVDAICPYLAFETLAALQVRLNSVHLWGCWPGCCCFWLPTQPAAAVFSA